MQRNVLSEDWTAWGGRWRDRLGNISDCFDAIYYKWVRWAGNVGYFSRLFESFGVVFSVS